MTVEILASQPVTASEVREHFRSDESALNALPESAQATVVQGARGRLAPEAIAAFNEGRKPSAQYREGAPRTIALDYKRVTKSGTRTKRAFVRESDARRLAGEVAGERGPLSAAAKAVAAEALAAQVNG
jgi:hypothetical protein